MTGPADDRELREFLARQPGIDAVQIFLTDPCGVARGKLVRRHELAAIFANGRQVAGSILGLDVTGMDVDATGLVWDTGDADMVCRPVAGTLTPVTWLPVPSGQLMLTMFDRDGKPAPAMYYAFDPPFIVNFDDDQAVRFLQLQMQALAREQAVLDALKLHEPLVRNNLLMLMNGRDYKSLMDRDGKEKLRQECLKEIQRILTKETGKPGVEDLLFTSFVVQ